MQPDPVGWVCAGSVSECAPDRPLVILTPKFPVAIFQVRTTYIAIKDRCPHADWALSRGTLSDATITCPGHAWQFDLRTGQCLRGDTECSLRLFPVEVRGTALWVKIA
ncbi:MAG: Rieske (2Fe-2S) protein [Deltaproteobacteria bacterium]|nr:Rieske (2Fe-2S) protein [Deltaproteobacteria bacterium]